MQAGSSILLSKQYMEIVKKRLKLGGTFAIYSNALGNLAQALVVRKTAAQVFKYYESFGDGYMLVVSDALLSTHWNRSRRSCTRCQRMIRSKRKS